MGLPPSFLGSSHCKSTYFLVTALTDRAYGGPGVAAKQTKKKCNQQQFCSHFHCLTLSFWLTEGVFSQHRVLQLTERADAHCILCSNAEDIQRALVKRSHRRLQLFDGGVHGLPAFASHVALLHHIVGDAWSSVTLRCRPLQVSAVSADADDLQPSRSWWRIWKVLGKICSFQVEVMVLRLSDRVMMTLKVERLYTIKCSYLRCNSFPIQRLC